MIFDNTFQRVYILNDCYQEYLYNPKKYKNLLEGVELMKKNLNVSLSQRLSQILNDNGYGCKIIKYEDHEIYVSEIP